MELLIIGLILGYLLRGTNNKVGCIRLTGSETGSVKPLKDSKIVKGGLKSGPNSARPKGSPPGHGTKPETLAKKASEIQPPIPPPAREIEEGFFFRG